MSECDLQDHEEDCRCESCFISGLNRQIQRLQAERDKLHATIVHLKKVLRRISDMLEKENS